MEGPEKIFFIACCNSYPLVYYLQQDALGDSRERNDHLTFIRGIFHCILEQGFKHIAKYFRIDDVRLDDLEAGGAVLRIGENFLCGTFQVFREQPE